MLPLTPDQQQLVVANLGLARKAAFRRLRGKHGRLSHDELLSAAYVGLIYAVTRYQAEKGRFSTFAMKCADNAILGEIKGDKLIRIPVWTLTKKIQQKFAIQEQQYYAGTTSPRPVTRGVQPDHFIWRHVKRAHLILPASAIEPDQGE